MRNQSAAMNDDWTWARRTMTIMHAILCDNTISLRAYLGLFMCVPNASENDYRSIGMDFRVVLAVELHQIRSWIKMFEH